MSWSWRLLTFLAFVGLVLLVLPNKTLICQRVELKKGNCQLTESNLFWSNTQEIPLESLQGAKVETEFGDSYDTNRIVLLTKAGEIPFISDSNDRGNVDRTANDINSFVKSLDRKSLKINQGDRLYIIFLVGLYLLGRLLILLVGVLISLGQKFIALANKNLDKK
ncbi:hypothetical protein QUB05_02655 [Microcoleus sp. F10-C6]|uniref:hypothetical protein n=1 Tax=unclassified Microcoleus TaxID=2642155 RepID=UPI002FD07188